ncbi:ProQ/FinO family protein [Aquincola sp. S2]|uniref:ProQ/FinO family protein n=2 Tax=Pseudaquabacterium terrae TaxID=2732868 RepID=A0ABX2EKB6_9BURK|nr:ProQ/FinO family protein [Aquabacterium terrae]
MADEAAAPAPAPAARAPEADPAEVAAKLKALFPALFAGAPKPVKLRVQEDIQARAPGQFSKRDLSAFFRRHTLGNGYLIALTKAAERFDLDGQPAGPVSDVHREAAREELKRRRARREERDAAERQQRALVQQEQQRERALVQQEQQREQAEVLQQRRDRARLLRDFETTRLTTPNFCALKGMTPEQLEAVLVQARKEAAEAPPPFVQPGGDRPPRRDDRRPPRPDDQRRPPRRDAGGPRPPGAGQPPQGQRRPEGAKKPRPPGPPRPDKPPR